MGKPSETIRKTEKLLRLYRPLTASIENLKDYLEELKALKPSLDGIDYSREKVCPTNKILSEVEEKAIKIITAREEIELKIFVAQTKVNRIERALTVLSDTELEIIKQRYFLNEPYFKFTHKINRSESGCKFIRRTAVIKLSIALFGEG